MNTEGWAFHDVVIPSGLPAITSLPGYCIVTTPALAPNYCQPYLDLMFTYASDQPATTASSTTEASTTTATTATTSTSVETTTTTPPTTSATTTTSSVPAGGD